jgi:hypothetical protein
MAYLVEIFEKPCTSNKSTQDPKINILTHNNKVTIFMKKLEMWKRNT